LGNAANELSYEIGVTKPDREIFDRMVLDSGIKPEETLFVDDGNTIYRNNHLMDGPPA